MKAKVVIWIEEEGKAKGLETVRICHNRQQLRAAKQEARESGSAYAIRLYRPLPPKARRLKPKERIEKLAPRPRHRLVALDRCGS